MSTTTSVASLAESIHPSQLSYTLASHESDYLFIKNFCHDSLPATERPQEYISQQLGTSETIKAQIVYLTTQSTQKEKTTTCGIVIYEENTLQPKSITIHLLRTTDDSRFSGKGISRHMLYKMTSIANRLQCTSIYASINPLDQLSLQFFEKNAFQRAQESEKTSSSQEVLLVKKLVNQEELVRKRVASTPAPIQEPSRELPPKVAHTQKTPAPNSAKPIEATLKNPYLSFIKNGKKTIEGRIAAGMFARVCAGTRIRFFNQQDQVLCLITKVTKYTSFAEMLKNEGVEKCLPGTASLEAGIRIYDNIPSYTERARRSGVLALQLQVEGT